MLGESEGPGLHEASVGTVVCKFSSWKMKVPRKCRRVISRTLFVVILSSAGSEDVGC